MAKKVGMGGRLVKADSNRWEDYLDADEKLLWQGAPATGLRFSGKGAVMSVFGVFFFGFSVFWITMAATMANTGSAFDFLFPLFGLPFVAVGFWLVIGHWFFDAYKRKKSRYALTNKRAIIARSVFGRKLESYEITENSPVSLVQGTFDTVNFAHRKVQSKNGVQTVDIGFRFITEGLSVFNLLKSIKVGKL